MKIGIDFDNTIVNYTGVFYQIALEKNLIPENIDKSKSSVRDYLRKEGREKDWTFLQGYVYGACMDQASPYEGIQSFISWCSTQQIPCFIVSHKTQYPYSGYKYDLHTSSKKWLKKKPVLSSVPVFFETTLQKKLKKIEELQVDYFIDDLPELFLEPNFPQKPQKILFDSSNQHSENTLWLKFCNWKDLLSYFQKKCCKNHLSLS